MILDLTQKNTGKCEVQHKGEVELAPSPSFWRA